MLSDQIRKSQMVLHSLCRSISLCAILALSSAILSPMLMTTNVCGFSRVVLGYLHGFTRSHAGGYLVMDLSPFKNSYDLIGRGIRHLLPNMFPWILLLNWCGPNESAVIIKKERIPWAVPRLIMEVFAKQPKVWTSWLARKFIRVDLVRAFESPI